MEGLIASGDPVVKSTTDVPSLLSTNNYLVDRQLDILDNAARAIKRNIGVTEVDEDVLVNYMDEVKSLKARVEALEREILALEEYGGRMDRASEIQSTLFDLKVGITRLLKKTKESACKVVETPLMANVNLPRIEIPRFDGNLLNWQPFWEQFQAAVHDKPQLGEVEKLTYLRDALKGGPAMYVISGLTQTAESYGEAIQCLKDRYDRPRVTHHEHVRSILQAPVMKVRNGKELRRLHDVCNQHIRALKLAGQLDIETFLTIALELKLDEATRLKWMEYSNDSKTTPPHEELLKFLDSQAQHHESVSSERKPQTTTHRSYAAVVEDSCAVCGRENHPLAGCSQFQRMTREERWDIVKREARCKNCLKVGHRASRCRAPPMCKRCNKYHHALLHIEAEFKEEDTENVDRDVTYVAPSKGGEEVLLMTCRVKVITPDGTVTQARALLDSAASTSLITERFANKLRLPRRHSNRHIKGVGGVNVRSKGAVKFKVAGVRGSGKQIEVDASILPQVTADLPTIPVCPVTRWKHLSDLELADPGYGVPAQVDILLGGKVFSKAVLHGRRFGPSGAPSAFKTCFGWVLNGEAKGETKQHSYVCGVALSNSSIGMRKRPIGKSSPSAKRKTKGTRVKP